MRAVERKTGLGRVIEAPEGPATGIVTVRACRPDSAGMHILVGMAFNAAQRRITESPAFVAALAVGLLVPADQGKGRQTVVEGDAARPVGFVVAQPAVFAFLTGMRIVCRVAAEARCGR